MSYQPRVGDMVLLFIDGRANGKKLMAEIREVVTGFAGGDIRVAYYDETQQRKILVYAARAVPCLRTGVRLPYSWDVPAQYS